MRRSRGAVSAYLATAALVILACSDSVTPHHPGSDDGQLVVSISPKHDSISIGATRQLTASVTEGNGDPSTRPVDWKSDNGSVATVSANGLVTAVAVGTARILARTGTNADTATIVVRPATPLLVVEPNRVSIASGEHLPLTVSPNAGVAAFDAELVQWSTSDSSIATVSAEGVVTTVDEGSATITAVLGTATGTAALAVFKNPIASIQIAPTTTTVLPGETVMLKAVALDADGRKVPVRSLTWSSSDPNVAPVSDNGQVKGKSRGTAIVSVTVEDHRASATVNVLNEPLSAVAVTLGASSISVGQTTQGTATLTTADGSTVTDRVVAWQSSNPSIVTVDANGVVKGIASGSGTVSAISDGKIGSANITVTANVPTSLTIVPDAVTAVLGSTAQLVAELRDRNGVLMPAQPVTWSSSNTAVASVSSSGLVTSLSIGTATISATSSGLTGTAAFTATAVPVASVSISPCECTLDVGQTTQLTATVRGVNGATLADRPITWTSENPAIAGISSSGVVNAIAPGSTTVTATVEGQSASIAISVKALPPAPIATISVTLDAASVLVGQSTQAVAVVKDAAGNVLEDRPVTWTSNDPTLATVNASGVVTAIAAGSVTLLACAEGKIGAATLQVDPPPPAPVASVVLTAPTTTLALDGSTQVLATLRDSSGKILTGRTIAWSSSAPVIASVGATGIVTAVAAGTATIRATSEGVQGSLAFTVTAPSAPAAVATVSVTLTPTALMVGSTGQATATPRDAAGNVLADRVVAWSSANAAVASVSSTGLVTALSGGSATITATVEGKTGAATASVSSPTSTVISPGESIQAKVDANAAGTAFVLKAGVHRLQQVRPKSGNTFAGEPGAVMSGARLLTAFVREGGYWVAAGQTQDGADQATPPAGLCRTGYPRCHRPEDLFVDDVPLRHVGTLGEVGPGKWYFDYGADKIYFVDDPTGRRVEASVTRHAFVGTADGVTIRGLVIEKYANPTQQGAVSPGAYQQSGGRNWVIEDNTVRLTHGEGIRIGEGARVVRNKALRNGQLGMGGFGSGALVEGNEIAFNNWAGVEPEFAAGGAKFHGTSGYVTRDLVVRGNQVHDNAGHALWCDFNCVGTVYEQNVVENNTGWGVFHEISSSAVVRGNTLRGNGGGVFVSTSQGVEVYGNTITGPTPLLGLDQTRGTGAFGTLILADLWVHDNTLTTTSGTVGVIQTSGTNAAFTSRNVRFDRNTYNLSAPTARAFSWANGTLTQTEWRGYGLDPNGIFH